MRNMKILERYDVRIRRLTKALECSAMKNRGVNEAFTEAARVALRVEKNKDGKTSKRNTWNLKNGSKKCAVM